MSAPMCYFSFHFLLFSIVFIIYLHIFMHIWYLIDQQSSSIESVKRIPTGKSQIYSVDGRKLNNTQRGINIIRKDDGSSTKQLIR